jgi:hypothetical protein
MVDAPSGTVTLLFTDIEGSTKLLQRAGELYAELLAATDALFEKLGLAPLEENRQVRERFRDDAQESPDGGSRAEAWAQGHAMTLDQAVAYALTGEPVGVAPVDAIRNPP